MRGVLAQISEETHHDLINLVVRPEGGRNVVYVPVPPRTERLRNPTDPVLASKVGEKNGRRGAARIYIDPDSETIVRAPIPGPGIVADRPDPVSAPLLADRHIVPQRPAAFHADGGRLAENAGALPVRDARPRMRPEHVVHRVELDSRRQVPEACAPSGVPRGQHLPRRSVQVPPRPLRLIERPVLDQVRRLVHEPETRTHAHVRRGVLGSQELCVVREVPPRRHLGQRRELGRQRDARRIIVCRRREVPRDPLGPAGLIAQDRRRRRTRKERDDDEKQDDRFGQVA